MRNSKDPAVLTSILETNCIHRLDFLHGFLYTPNEHNYLLDPYSFCQEIE